VAHPRRIVTDATYLITRRCHERTFRLRPRAETNRIFMYCLAFAMQKTGVRLHAVCVMSNHHHLVVTDPNGLLPDFLRELHRLTAKAINASQGQWEHLWAAEPCNVVRLTTDEDVADKIAYVAANPVAAGLVSDPSAWPGLLAWGGREERVARPKRYFSDEGTCPEELVLVVEAPPTRSEDATWVQEWIERVRKVLARKVTEAREAVRAAGRAFLGREAVLATSFARRARSYEERRGVVPTFAAQSKAVRVKLRRLEQRFRAGYRAALADWRKGLRLVAFPHGTWGMRVFHAATVGPPFWA
jgi:REP element-mobilizing transposase RayT